MLTLRNDAESIHLTTNIKPKMKQKFTSNNDFINDTTITKINCTYSGIATHCMDCYQRVNLELLVADYDRIGSSDPIGKVVLGYNRKGLELKHWKEMIENPRRPIVHWHVLKVTLPIGTVLWNYYFTSWIVTTVANLMNVQRCDGTVWSNCLQYDSGVVHYDCSV